MPHGVNMPPKYIPGSVPLTPPPPLSGIHETRWPNLSLGAESKQSRQNLRVFENEERKKEGTNPLEPHSKQTWTWRTKCYV